MRLEADVAVVGSGFGGSLMALALRKRGRSVVLLERGRVERAAVLVPVDDQHVREPDPGTRGHGSRMQRNLAPYHRFPAHDEDDLMGHNARR